MSTAGFSTTERTDSPSRTVPVSRVSFSLTDRAAFDESVQLAVGWLERTASAKLPPEAAAGLSFEMNGSSAKAAVSALRLDDDRGRVWAARGSFNADRTAQRTWVSDLFVEQRAGAFVRFGAQLTCNCLAHDPGFDHSRPRVVRDILQKLAAETDGEELSDRVLPVDEHNVDRLVSLLYDRNRRLPVVLVSTDDAGRAQLDLARVANRLSGTAHLHSIQTEASFELSRTIGKRMSTFNGAVRIYMPGLEQDMEDPFRHPLWLASRSGWNPKLEGLLASRVLPLGFRDADGDARFWRVGLLRQATFRAAANAASGTHEERLQAENQALRAEADAAREAAQAAESLMYEEASKLADAQAQVAQLEEANYGLRERTRVASLANPSRSAVVSADDIYAVFGQNPSLDTALRVISSVFPDRVTIPPSAYESARDSFAFLHRKKAFELLWSLATDYWSALSDGQGDGAARQCFGAAFAAREADTLSKAGRKRRTFEYKGNEIEMPKHLKIGVADNKSDTLRVHFEWLSDEGKVIVGHCGSHIDF